MHCGIFFFLKEPATTAIYTYCHTLALHDALPIYVRVPKADLVGEPNKGWTMAKALLGFERLFLGNPRMPEYALNRLRDLGEKTGRSGDAAFADRFTRSEERTSELQSLMRISYAVFCLKKKKIHYTSVLKKD